MLSTLMNYRLYSADMAKSLARIASQASVQRDADYYKANIGKVKSPDDLLKDQRLYSYAMKAYGLEDQIQSKGLMRKVLESDLSQSDSFANKLVDKRYREFAAAFQFGAPARRRSRRRRRPNSSPKPIASTGCAPPTRPARSSISTIRRSRRSRRSPTF